MKKDGRMDWIEIAVATFMGIVSIAGFILILSTAVK